MSKIYDGDEKISTPSTLGRIRVNKIYLILIIIIFINHHHPLF